MDLMAGATVFAQIVSLLAIFTSGRASGKIDQKQDFLAWLAANNHEELRQLLERNSETIAGIQALLNENHEALLARLENIDEILAKLLSHIEGFEAVVIGINPAAALSEQAISILRQLDQSGVRGFFEGEESDTNKSVARPMFVLVNTGGRKHVEYTNDRLVHDDLRSLVTSGLLHSSCNKAGNPMYEITRAGTAYVQATGSIPVL